MTSGLLLLFVSLTELAMLFMVIAFFWRLKKSEHVLNELQGRHEELLSRLQVNAQLEQELVFTFERRQAELTDLDRKLEERSQELNRLLRQAEKFTQSPQFLREIVLSGHNRGQTPQAIARASGLSVDEVELIIDQSKS